MLTQKSGFQVSTSTANHPEFRSAGVSIPPSRIGGAFPAGIGGADEEVESLRDQAAAIRDSGFEGGHLGGRSARSPPSAEHVRC